MRPFADAARSGVAARAAGSGFPVLYTAHFAGGGEAGAGGRCLRQELRARYSARPAPLAEVGCDYRRVPEMKWERQIPKALYLMPKACASDRGRWRLRCQKAGDAARCAANVGRVSGDVNKPINLRHRAAHRKKNLRRLVDGCLLGV